jgi:serine protease Do
MGPDGDLQGLGTAFAIDPWGKFITADHVVAEIRNRGRTSRQKQGWTVVMPQDEGLVLILGFGLAFGTVAIPSEAILRIVKGWSPCFEGDDPLAALDGRMDVRPADISFLNTTRPPSRMLANLPLVSRARGPRIGDIVVAIGFPGVATFRGNVNEARTIVEEGMFVAYGQVTALHANGRDHSTPTPVFEVKANWPPGMSGGPVFNKDGVVIGVVSRSLLPEEGKKAGIGWATWLERFRALPTWTPTVDQANPDCRWGWGILRNKPWHLVSVEGTEADAKVVLARVNQPGYAITRGVWRIGTDDFISNG